MKYFSFLYFFSFLHSCKHKDNGIFRRFTFVIFSCRGHIKTLTLITKLCILWPMVKKLELRLHWNKHAISNNLMGPYITRRRGLSRFIMRYLIKFQDYMLYIFLPIMVVNVVTYDGIVRVIIFTHNYWNLNETNRLL